MKTTTHHLSSKIYLHPDGTDFDINTAARSGSIGAGLQPGSDSIHHRVQR